MSISITPDKRNVNDYYKAWEHDAIVADLDKQRSPFVNICMNLTGDFSKSSIIRNANAFLAQETWLIGKRKFDPRGAVGTHHYEKVKHSEEWQPIFSQFKNLGYTIFAVDNIPGFKPQVIYDAVLPEKSVFVYGEEQAGLSEEIIEACDEMIYIPQFGSVRSINVAVAAGIVMYEWCRQNKPDIKIGN